MASRAYVLIENGVGRTKDMVGALKGMKGVEECSSVIGQYDPIAIVEGTDVNEVNNVITGRIHHLPGITHTLTCTVINP